MTYLKSKTAFWPELILLLLMQLKLAEARALAEAVAQTLPPQPKGSAPPPEAEQPPRQDRIAPSPRRRQPAAAAAAQGSRRPEALEAELRARPPAMDRAQARPLRATRLALAASSGDARLPGSTPQAATTAQTTPASQAIQPDARSQSPWQRPMTPPPPPRPLSWSYAAGADALTDGDAGQPTAAAPASQPDSAAGPMGQASPRPAAAQAMAGRALPPAPPPLALRRTAALDRQTGGQSRTSRGSLSVPHGAEAAGPPSLNPAKAAGEAELAASAPMPAAATPLPPQPSLAGPLVIIPIRMVAPSAGAGAVIEGHRPAGTQSAGTQSAGHQAGSSSSSQGLQLMILNAADPGAGEGLPPQLPAAVALSQALRQQLPVSAGSGTTATAAVMSAGEAQGRLVTLSSREELVRLCSESGAALLAGGSVVGTLPVEGGRLFWIGAAGLQAGDDSGGPGQGGSDPTGPDSLSDTLVVWFTPGDGSAPGPGETSDWISDLKALSEEIDRITSAAAGDPEPPAGGGSGAQLFQAVQDAMADLAAGSGLFVQIDCLNDLASPGTSPSGDPFA